MAFSPRTACRHHPDADGLARQRDELRLAAPDEIWICTTLGASTQAGIVSLLDWVDGLPPLPLRIWQADDTEDWPVRRNATAFATLGRPGDAVAARP